MITIRPIAQADYKILHELIKEFSKFENTWGDVTNSVDLMKQEADLIWGFIAEIDSEIAGYTTYFFPYHTWVGKCIHMDDLYIKEKFRGQGVGKALFNAIKKIGVKENCKSMHWQVSDWNEEAQAFYKSQGAKITNSEFDCSLTLS